MKIGFLGCGNMGGALARAVRRADPSAVIILSDTDKKKRDALAAEISAKVAEADAMIREANYVFLGLKPQILPAVIPTLSEAIGASRATFISMAAGVTLSSLAALLGDVPIIRIMPNTAVEVGEGMTVFAKNDAVTENMTADFAAMMSASGRCDELPEAMIDAACAVSGCGPAFAYLFLEALADGGVACGLPRDRALAYAAQTLKGAMSMAISTGRHPGDLKDAVCSPGGSTIAGVHALEEGGLRAAAMNAVMASYRRTAELGKK